LVVETNIQLAKNKCSLRGVQTVLVVVRIHENKSSAKHKQPVMRIMLKTIQLN
jgi:hypothetical protein